MNIEIFEAGTGWALMTEVLPKSYRLSEYLVAYSSLKITRISLDNPPFGCTLTTLGLRDLPCTVIMDLHEALRWATPSEDYAPLYKQVLTVLDGILMGGPDD